MTLTNIEVIKSDDLDYINLKLWNLIDKKGTPLRFGDRTHIKWADEIFAVFQIYGKALDRLYNGDLPKGWLFGTKSNKVYIQTIKNKDKGDQPYTYGQRAHEDGDENPIENSRDALKESIGSGIQSNRNCGTIWRNSDIHLKSPPCWQWWQVRHSEKNKVSARLLMRSNDAGDAYAANLGAFVTLLVDEICTPAGGVLEELILIAVSEHIYKTDRDMVDAFLGKIPEQYRGLI